MARIENFEKAEMQRMQLHDVVDAKYYVHEYDGRNLLQISTFGRPTRDIRGKLSQTIQLDSDAARQLFDILRENFGFR